MELLEGHLIHQHWSDLAGVVFTRSKANFVGTIHTPNSYSTYKYYNPIKNDADYKSGG